MNEIANLCDLVGANVEMVRKASDPMPAIGSKFLYPAAATAARASPRT